MSGAPLLGPGQTARRVIARALVLAAEKENAARPRKTKSEELLDEEALVREGRAVARRLGVEVRTIERLIRWAVRSQEVRETEAGPKPPLAAALSHVVVSLRRALVDVEQGRTDLETSFSARDLAQAIRKAQGPKREPDVEQRPKSQPAESERRRRRRRTSGRGK